MNFFTCAHTNAACIRTETERPHHCRRNVIVRARVKTNFADLKKFLLRRDPHTHARQVCSVLCLVYRLRLPHLPFWFMRWIWQAVASSAAVQLSGGFLRPCTPPVVSVHLCGIGRNLQRFHGFSQLRFAPLQLMFALSAATEAKMEYGYRTRLLARPYGIYEKCICLLVLHGKLCLLKISYISSYKPCMWENARGMCGYDWPT